MKKILTQLYHLHQWVLVIQGNYAMCGKAYDPRLIVAWPTAEIAPIS